ncbi:MAG: ABC transporter permease [Akkermansiaceae bacterium]|nr:ABC transporter permease [Akkermansia sp.]MCD7798430.1 ABC transporter permease [Akkermansiaceae bacterium]MCD8070248.1 ABC transporter permease [Akkermansiaceae bacterium]
MTDSDFSPTPLRTRFRDYWGSIRTIYGKELKSYLFTPFGWVVLACIMALQSFSLHATLQMMQAGPVSEGILFYMLDNQTFWFYFLFMFPLITMRTFAEEERLGTLEGLLTAPVTTGQVVLGKYAAAFTFYMLLWLPLLLYPWLSEVANLWTEMRFGDVPGMALEYRLADWLGAFLILFLVGAWFLSLGLLCSAMTRSQIIAGILTIGTLITYYFLGRVTALWGEFPAAPAFHYISCYEQIDAFSRGMIDTRPAVLYVTLTVLTLAFTQRIVDYRRWRR